MELRVVTDVERAMEKGLAPERSEMPHDREGLLLPLTMRERALVCAIDSALRRLNSAQPDVTRAVSTLETVFGATTGCVWDPTPW